MVDLNGLNVDGSNDKSDSGGSNFKLDKHGRKIYPNIPDGEYLVYLSKSEERSKNQTYILFEFRVFHGRYKGRKIWYMAFITGKMANNGIAFIRKLKEATGVLDAKDTDDMLDIPIIASIELVEDTYRGEGLFKESIIGLKKAEGVDLDSLNNKGNDSGNKNSSNSSGLTEDDDIPF